MLPGVFGLIGRFFKDLPDPDFSCRANQRVPARKKVCAGKNHATICVTFAQQVGREGTPSGHLVHNLWLVNELEMSEQGLKTDVACPQP